MKEKKECTVAALPADKLLSTDEVAAVLGTTRTFVNRIINARLMLSLYFGRSKRVPTSVLNKFIADHVGHDIIAEVERIEEGKKGMKESSLIAWDDLEAYVDRIDEEARERHAES